jgi:BASS family bile acid:Na+ symporter
VNVNGDINALATLTLVQMMVTTGMSVTPSSISPVARDWKLILRAIAANYILVPAATVALLLALHADPMAGVGFLLVATCPGAPYGPPFTSLAKGNVPAAVGLMVILAASSAFAAPVLLGLLTPLIAAGQEIHVDTPKLILVLAFSQLLPLCAGMALRSKAPRLSDRLARPFARLSTLLNVLLIGTILVVNFGTLLEIRPLAYVGMLALVGASVASGWILAGRGERKTLAITTSMRNVGVSLVIATSSFPGSLAVTAVTAYALVQTIVMLAAVMAWGRAGGTTPSPKSPGAAASAIL